LAQQPKRPDRAFCPGRAGSANATRWPRTCFFAAGAVRPVLSSPALALPGNPLPPPRAFVRRRRAAGRRSRGVLQDALVRRCCRDAQQILPGALRPPCARQRTEAAPGPARKAARGAPTRVNVLYCARAAQTGATGMRLVLLDAALPLVALGLLQLVLLLLPATPSPARTSGPRSFKERSICRGSTGGGQRTGAGGP
jgi:hypothetical protein